LFVVDITYLNSSSLLSLCSLTLESLHHPSSFIFKVNCFAHVVFILGVKILSRSHDLVQSTEVFFTRHGEVVLLVVVHTLSFIIGSVVEIRRSAVLAQGSRIL
jgi:hypothetical protein